MNLDEFRPEQRLSASLLNELRREVERLGKISTAPPLGHADGGAGLAFWADLPLKFWIKLTGGGTSGKYDWTRQQPGAGGTWSDYPGTGQSGTASDDPAIETSSNATISLSPEPIVLAWRDAVTNELLFEGPSC